MISLKEHLTTGGLYKLVAIKFSLNKGLPAELKQIFPQLKPILRPVINNIKYIINPYWQAGFISAKGCFFIHIEKVNNNEVKPDSRIEKVRLRFQIYQHLRDTALLKSFIGYFDCGKYYPRYSQGILL